MSAIIIGEGQQSGEMSAISGIVQIRAICATSGEHQYNKQPPALSATNLLTLLANDVDDVAQFSANSKTVGKYSIDKCGLTL